jgi:hypothetical protein
MSFVDHAALTTSGPHTIYSRFDFAKVKGWNCQIEQIRPVDYRRMQADLRNQNQQAPDAGPSKSAN